MCVRRLEASRDIALKKMAAAPLSTEELADPVVGFVFSPREVWAEGRFM